MAEGVAVSVDELRGTFCPIHDWDPGDIGIPCAWPGCPHGVKEEEVQVVLTFKRETQWIDIGNGREPRFIWTPKPRKRATH